MTTSTTALRTAAPALVAATVLAVVCTGCGGSDQAKRAVHAELMSDADLDSVGLEIFFTLDEDERDVRRLRARTWRDHAAASDDAWARAEALQTAVGLAPDDPHAWLDLAETLDWFGDDLSVDGALLAATAALRHLNEPASDLRVTREERDEIVTRAALLRAWYHYQRAEYHEGLSWAKAAQQMKPGSSPATGIRGLLEAGVEHRAQAEIAAEEMSRRSHFGAYGSWIKAVLEYTDDNLMLAFARARHCNGPDERMTECCRDMALVSEALGEWDRARNCYEMSAAALPAEAARYRQRVDHLRLGEGAGGVEMPFWLAFDRYYLTGSLSAYTALVFERFTAAESRTVQDLWGGETVNAAGILLRLERDRAWALRARGLVFLAQENFERARADLERAEGLFAEEALEDQQVTAGLGRLWLRREDHKQALPFLERAVLLGPADPEVWSDLGLVRVMARDQDGAAAAFGRAIELDPDAATAWYNRGLMRLHAGDLDAATADLGEAARLAPDNLEISRLLQRIRVMQRDGGTKD